MSPALPTLSSAFSLLAKPAQPTATSGMQTSTPATAATPINWNAVNVKPAAPAPTFGISTAKPALPSLSSTMQTSTPATATPMTSFNAKPAAPATGNLQSSDTALRPGQFGAGPFATVNADGSSTPSAYSKMPALPSMASSAPSTPATPAFVQTPSGTANPATGAMVTPSTPAQNAVSGDAASVGSNTGNATGGSSYSYSAGGSPALPYSGGSYNPLITTPEAEDLFKKYMDSQKPSDEELAATENLNRLNTAAATAYTNTQNQPIALPFITGQQAAQQRSQALLAQPLESQIALLQAKRQTASTVSKAALDRADAMTKARRDLATSTVSVPFGSTAAAFNAATGKFEPINAGSISGADDASQDSWVNLIKGGQAKLEDVPQQLRQGVAEKLSSSPAVSKANQDAIAQADTVIQKVLDIMPTIDGSNTGAMAYLAGIKGTPQYNLATQLDTIKANVGFAALQAMRAASPTGGALGQVSEQENRLLQSTLASLDQGQSAEQLKANLAKVQLHFQNLKQILNAPINAQVDYDAAGNVIIKAPAGGAFSSQPQQSSSSSGSIYDW